MKGTLQLDPEEGYSLIVCNPLGKPIFTLKMIANNEGWSNIDVITVDHDTKLKVLSWKDGERILNQEVDSTMVAIDIRKGKE